MIKHMRVLLVVQILNLCEYMVKSWLRKGSVPFPPRFSNKERAGAPETECVEERKFTVNYTGLGLPDFSVSQNFQQYKPVLTINSVYCIYCLYINI